MATSDCKPIKWRQHFELINLGIEHQDFTVQNLTMESEKFICIRETIKNSTSTSVQAVILDMREPTIKLMRRLVLAESILINPRDSVMALRDKKVIELVDLATNRTKTLAFWNYVIEYWKWIDLTTIGLVLRNCVHHLSTDKFEPKKMFDRHSALIGKEIVDYRMDEQQKWLLLTGHSIEKGRVVGVMQLYNVETRQSLTMEGHAGIFAKIKLDGNSELSNLMCVAVRSGNGAKLHIFELDRPTEGNKPFTKKTVNIYFQYLPDKQLPDFPIAMQRSTKYDIIYLVTNYGYIHLYDLESGDCLYRQHVSSEKILATAPLESSGGILCVNQRGQVMSGKIDEDKIIPYILHNLSNLNLALRVAWKNNFSGVEQYYIQQFETLLKNAEYSEAAELAAKAPKDILRTTYTIQLLEQSPCKHHEVPPLLIYFWVLAKRSQLDESESVSLCRYLYGKPEGVKEIEIWLKNNKLKCSSELGDIVKQFNPSLARNVYHLAKAPHKVLQCMVEMDQFEQILLYSQKFCQSPDYSLVFRNVIRSDPKLGIRLAKYFVQNQTQFLTVDQIVDIFMEANLISDCTTFLLDILKDDKPIDGPLQTRLLQINIIAAPQVACEIIKSQLLNHWDKRFISEMCAQAGLPIPSGNTQTDFPSPLIDAPNHSVSPTQTLSSNNIKQKSLEHRGEKKEDLCQFCCEKPVNCACIPCGHMCFCFDCAKAYHQDKGNNRCAICREVCKDILKIYSC